MSRSLHHPVQSQTTTFDSGTGVKANPIVNDPERRRTLLQVQRYRNILSVGVLERIVQCLLSDAIESFFHFGGQDTLSRHL
jgi:hypothetical protein